MAKLTKMQRRTIESALASINRAIHFIEQDSIAVCHAGEINTEVPHIGTGDPGHSFRAASAHRIQHYTGQDGLSWSIVYVRELQPIDKGIGSDLVSIYTARTTLINMLDDEGN